MATFLYKARDPKGNLVNGVLEAPDEGQVVESLQKLDLSPVAITVQSAFQKFFEKDATWRPVPHQEILVFTRQLSTLVSSGVPLIQCLENISRQIAHPRFKFVVLGLVEKLKSGNSLSQAMANYPDIFSEFYISMLKVGEAGGLMDKVLKRLADLSAQDLDLRSRLKSALIYPALLAGVAFVIVNFVMIAVLPKFVSIFEASDAKLPLPTVLLLTISDLLRHYWWVGVGGLFLLAWWLKVYYKSSPGRYKIDALALRLPMAGPLILKILVCRFCRSIAALTKSGVPILESLKVVQGTVGNAVLEVFLQNIQESISRGNSLTEPFENSGLFPPMVIQMISTGERSGQLGEMFDQIADFYEPEVEYTIRNLTSILEPVMLLVMGAIVTFIALSVLLPIFNLIKIIRR